MDLDLDLIELNVSAKSSGNVIELLGEKMRKKGYVKDTYVAAVLDREKNLPTGLNLGEFSVAIPHTNAEHVVSSHFGVAVLNQPVVFHSMIDPTEELGVDLVFLLAINDPAGQVSLLKKLMSIFQDVELLKKIKAAETKEEIKTLLKIIQM